MSYDDIRRQLRASVGGSKDEEDRMRYARQDQQKRQQEEKNELQNWANLAKRGYGNLRGYENQLDKDDWASLSKDGYYRRALGQQIQEAQGYLSSLKKGSVTYKDASEYLTYLQELQKDFADRGDYYGQFKDEEEFDILRGISAGRSEAKKKGESYNDYYLRTKQGAARADEAYQAAQQRKTQMQQDVNNQRQYLDRTGILLVDGQILRGKAAEDYLKQKQDEVNSVDQEIQQKAKDAEYAKKVSGYAKAGRYADLQDLPDWQEQVAAGKKAHESYENPIYTPNFGATDPLAMAVDQLISRRENSKVKTPEYSPGEDWADEDVNRFYYLYATDPEAAADFAWELNAAGNASRLAEQQKKTEAWTNRSGWNRAAAWGAGVLSAPFQMADYIGSGLEYAATGRVMPHENMTPADVANTMSAAAARYLNDTYGTIGDKTPVLGGKGWGDVFQLSQSIAQSAAAASMGGGATNLLFFGSAANQGFQDAKARGASDGEALILGFLNGSAEVLGETVSVEKLISIKNPATIRRYLWNVAKQGGIEASEETFTTILNTFADEIVMGDKSELQQNIRQLMAQGMSRAEAEKQAWQEWTEGLAGDALGGFLSGGISAGGRQAVGMIRSNAIAYSGEDAQHLVEVGLEQKEGSAAYKLAQKIQEQGTMSEREAQRLTDLLGEDAEAIHRNQRAELKQEAERRLQEAGLGQRSAARSAETVTRELLGEELDREGRADRERDFQNETVRQVARQMEQERRTEALRRFVQAQADRTEKNSGKKVNAQLQRAFRASGIQLSEHELEILTDGFIPGSNRVNSYVIAARDGYRLGKSGMTLEQAAKSSDYAGKVYEQQFRHAWELGKQAAGGTVTESGTGPSKESTVQIKGQEGSSRILGLTRGADGQLQARVAGANGGEQTVSISEIDFGESGLDELVDALKGRADAEQIFSAYHGGMSVGSYIRAWDTAKAYGQATGSRTVESVLQDSMLEGMDEASIRAAFAYGRSLKEQQKAKRAERDSTTTPQSASQTAPLAQGSQGKGGVSYDGGTVGSVKLRAVNRNRLTPKQRAQIRVVDALGKKFGIQFVLFQSEMKNGRYKGFNGLEQNGVIYLDVNAGMYGRSMGQVAIVRTAAHEMTHWMREFNEERYQELQEFLLDNLAEWKGKDLGQMVAGKMARDKSGKLTSEGALEEVVADGCEMMLSRTKTLQTLAEEKPGLFQAVRDWLQGYIETVKEAFQGVSAVHDEARAVESWEQEKLEKFTEIWFRGLEEAAERAAKSPAREGGAAKYSFVGTREDGIEVYETSEETKALSWKERKKHFMKLMRNEYKDRTARFKRNGHTFFARFEETDMQKTVYGDRESDEKGYGAKINAGADGDYLDLLENMEWFGGEKERGKGTKAHKDVAYWNYFLKTVQIDGQVYDLLANVRHKKNGAYVYDLELYERKNVEAASPPSLPEGKASAGVPTASDNSIPASEEESKSKFQMRDEVEETPKLVAVHNKSVSGLRRMLQRGGVPFPSIAIKKAGSSHEGFGDVSIVFPRSTIDPAASRWNRLYSNDAWTPTEPRTEYEVEDTWKLQQQMEKEIGTEVYRATKLGSYIEKNQLEKDLAASEGDIVKALKGRTGIKYAYLKSMGQEPTAARREKALDGFGRYKNDQLRAVFEKVPASEIRAMGYESKETLEKIADALNRQWLAKLPPETAKRLAGKKLLYSAEKINPQIIKDALRNYETNGGKMESEIDDVELERSLRDNKALEEDPKYQKWIRDRFGSLIKDSGIPNGKGMYTDSGNRRSFKARHVPATLENIVQQMRKEQEKGIGLGGINLRGAATKAYASVEEMRSESGKLLGTRVFDEEYDSYMKEFGQRLYDMTEQANKVGYDTANEILLETIRDAKSKTDMKRRLQNEGRWINYSEDLLDDLWQLRNDVQNMPAPYFEAKPRRVVYPEEALAYILPDNADADVMQELQKRGFEVLTYKAGDEQDRLEKLNSLEDAKFQERDELPDDRALLMQARAEGRNAESLTAYQKKVRSLEALERKLRRQQDGLESLREQIREIDRARGKEKGKAMAEARAAKENEEDKAKRKLLSEAIPTAKAQIAKTEASIRRAEKALADLERTPQIRQETEKALAAWREANPNDAARAIREMQQERDTMRKYVDLLRQEARLTTPETRRMLPSDILKLARNLVKENGSSAAVDQIAEALQELGDFMVEHMEGGGVGYFNQLTKMAQEIAQSIVSESYETLDENKETREGIRSYLKNHTLRISDDVRGDIPDFNAWRKKQMGTLWMGKDGLDIDVAYHDLQASYGEGLFPEDVLSRSDQLQQILEALDQVQPTYQQMFSRMEQEQAAAALGNEIVDRLLSKEVREKETMADKAFQRQLVAEKVHELRERSIERDKKYRGRIAIDKKVASLSKIMLENSGKHHVPDAWKEAIGNFLASIDTLTQRSGEGSRSFHVERIEALREMVRKQQLANEGKEERGEEQGPQVFLDINPYLADMLKPFIAMARDSSTGTIQVENLEVEQMKELEEVLTAIREAVDKSDVMLAAAEKGETLSKTAGETIRHLESLGKGKTGNIIRRFLSWDNLTPVFFFKRFGAGGERIFRELQRGWGKLAMNAKQIIDFSNATYTAKEARAWEQEVHEFKLIRRESDLSGRESLTKAAAEGGAEAAKEAEERNKETVKLSTAQIMGLYCLVKREQALGHILGGGIRIWDITAKPTLKERITGENVQEQAERYLVNQKDIAEITGALTERQKEVADALQKYMNTVGSAWGNEVSQARFGVDIFGEQNYYPISTDPQSRNARTPDADGADLFHILNMGFTKNTLKNARNGIVIHSIFDVFSNHMADMAKYNSMGLPMLDAMKWVNYLDETDGKFTSVRKAMEQALGKNAERYFLGLIQDLNGNFEGGRRGEDIASKLISYSKVASVGANIRVAALQPTSYVRALAVLDPKYMGKFSNLQMRKGIEEALKYSGTAVWKDLGFFDLNINANLRDLIKHTNGALEKIREGSMKGAELGDKLTWGALWNATKAEVQDKTGLTGEALLKATAERFDDVIYQTQVMDSTMTRSHLMRQKGAFASMVTSFMSEPTLSYNLLLDAVSNWEQTKRSGKAVKQASLFAARAFTVYAVSQVITSIVESVFDAMRDEDDYESFWEKWKQAEFGWDGNLIQDLAPWNKLPFLRDAVSIIQGFSNKRMDTEWMEYWMQAINAVIKDFKDGDFRWGTAFKAMRALSTVTGLPVANTARDAIALWNTFVVQSVPDWKLKTVKRSTVTPTASIKQAFQAGALSEEDAIRYLMRDAEIETEEKARQKLYEWGLEKGTKKYDKLLNAVYGGKDSKAARDELLQAGFSEDSLRSEVRSAVKAWYQGTAEDGRPRIEKDAAIRMLVKEGGMSQRDAEAKVREWSSYVSSPEKLQYEDVQAAYIAGEITAARAAEMRMLYGGKSKSEAQEEVQKWACEKETGIAYKDLKEAWIDGEISDSEAVEYQMKYGGQTKVNAEKTLQKWRYVKDTGGDYNDVKQGFLEGTISEQDAIDARVTYGGQTKIDAQKEIRKWTCEKETGIDYDDMHDLYLSGELSAERAAQLQQTYGGQTKTDAQKEVRKWTCEKETGIVYDDLQDLYLSGEVTAERASQLRVTYGGQTKIDADSEVLKWRCEKETGIRYSEMEKLFIGGELSGSRAADLRVKYGGQSKEKAKEEVLHWQCEKDTGIRYKDIRDAYAGGQISEEKVRQMLQKYGGYSETEAEGKALQYRFAGKDAELEDITPPAATTYYGSLEAAGVSKEVWYKTWRTFNVTEGDKNANGKTIKNSKKNKMVVYLNSLNLNAAQKDALYLALGFAQSGIRATPWH